MTKMKNILIVDDEKSFLLSLSEGLKMANKDFNIFLAENGEQAIEILKSVPINLLVTDLKMPLMDGFDLLMYVLKNHPNMPTIVMTAFSNPDVIRRLNEMGFPFCIEKPLEFEDLANKIQHLLKHHGSSGLDQIPPTNFMRGFNNNGDPGFF